MMRETREGGMAESTSKEQKDAELNYIRDYWDSVAKGINYLMVAQGATLVGCLSLLRDYNSVPQLRGMGLVIAISAVGLIFAALAYGASIVCRSLRVRAVYRERTQHWSVFNGLVIFCLCVSLISFVTIISGVAFHFAGI
jgi:hypothetical protein